MIDRPKFIVSDLHAGDRGPRDNFAVAGREAEFSDFVRYVRSEGGLLIGNGDTVDFWQAGVSDVLVKRYGLMMRFDALTIGNHELDLRQFISDTKLPWVDLPPVRWMRHEIRLEIAGRKILITHGHQYDSYCASASPGVGRMTAIGTGILEDAAGGPMLGKYKSVEDAAFSLATRIKRRLYRWAGWTCNDYETMLNRRLLAIPDVDAVIVSHTHHAGRIGERLYNSGTWAERVCSFVRVDPDGTIGVFDWIDGKAVPNGTALPC